MHDVTTLDLSRIAQDLQIRKTQVESVVQLLDEGNTIPFITRYRKERTGGLNEEVLRQVQWRVALQRQLADRKQTILKSIEGQGKLTPELQAAIVAADTSKRLEDLYLPYKPKKRSLATAAREKGLEPLALAIWKRDPAAANVAQSWASFVNPEKQLNTPEEVQAGVQHILAEMIAETVDVRAITRSLLWETGKICSVKSEKLPEGQGLDYKDYFDFNESLRQIPPHRILALIAARRKTLSRRDSTSTWTTSKLPPPRRWPSILSKWPRRRLGPRVRHLRRSPRRTKSRASCCRLPPVTKRRTPRCCVPFWKMRSRDWCCQAWNAKCAAN